MENGPIHRRLQQTTISETCCRHTTGSHRTPSSQWTSADDNLGDRLSPHARPSPHTQRPRHQQTTISETISETGSRHTPGPNRTTGCLDMSRLRCRRPATTTHRALAWTSADGNPIIAHPAPVAYSAPWTSSDDSDISPKSPIWVYGREIICFPLRMLKCHLIQHYGCVLQNNTSMLY